MGEAGAKFKICQDGSRNSFDIFAIVDADNLPVFCNKTCRRRSGTLKPRTVPDIRTVHDLE